MESALQELLGELAEDVRDDGEGDGEESEGGEAVDDEEGEHGAGSKLVSWPSYILAGVLGHSEFNASSGSHVFSPLEYPFHLMW